MTIVDLEIDGMTCSSCASRIERRLSRMPGVAASVNYATEVAHVTLPDGTSVADAIATVERTGYRASLPEPDSAARDAVAPLILRLVVSAVLATPVLAMSMVQQLQMDGWQWVALALTLPVALWGAWPFHRAAAINLRHGAATMDTLVSIGIVAALTWSAWALVFGDAGRAGMHMEMSWLGSGGTDEIYLEVAAVVTVFLLAGRLIEARAKRDSGTALRALARMGAKEATRVEGDVETRIPIAQLAVGDAFRVVPGEKIATDGIVLDGRSAVDASLVTGESMPIEIEPGSAVIGATINGAGALTVRATRVGADTELSRIAGLLLRAQEGKTRAQRLADRVSAVFVPAVLVIAVLTLAGWLLATGDVTRAFAAAVATLIIACPCALGLATPTALLVGTTRGAQLGILIRDATVLESTRAVTHVLVDKTGTVTEGRMSMVDAVPAAGESRALLLRLAASIERSSEHPIARAIAQATPDPPRAESFTSEAGHGVHGSVDGIAVQAGRPSWLAAEFAAPMPSELADAAAALEASGATTVAVAWDGRVRGVIAVRDAVKSTSAPALARLHRLGIDVGLLTGDSASVAGIVAEQVGIDLVIAGVTPAGKVDAVRELQQTGARVAMVGDGVNDAAALAQADLGLAMGTGTDAAMQAADITLVHGDLAGVADAIALARRTLRTIRGNLVWAFAYNVLAIPLAVAGLLSPLIAGAAMACSSVLVVASSMTLRWFSPTRD